MQVAVGGAHGDVCIYDISSGRLQAVQRMHVDEGPVTALACRLLPQQRHDVATAAAPRALDGGGLVEGPMGLPWRLPPHSNLSPPALEQQMRAGEAAAGHRRVGTGRVGCSCSSAWWLVASASQQPISLWPCAYPENQ